MVGKLAIVDQHPHQLLAGVQVALVVPLGRAGDGRGDVIAVHGRELHDEGATASRCAYGNTSRLSQHSGCLLARTCCSTTFSQEGS